MHCTCFIVPRDVLERLARDPDFSDDVRDAAARSVQISARLRDLRKQAGALTNLASLSGLPVAELAAVPAVTVYDCKHNQRLPGSPVTEPAASADGTAKRTFAQTSRLAEFYRK